MLCRRLLQEKDLKLTRLQEIARVMETADYQAEMMKKLTVNAVGKKRDNYRDKSVRSRISKTQSQSPRDKRIIKCYRCGRAGHVSRECAVTRNKKCNNCGKEGHFPKMCKTKTTHKVNRVMTTETHQQPSYSEDDHVFTVSECDAEETLSVPVDMLIDSGASCNIVTESVKTKK